MKTYYLVLNKTLCEGVVFDSLSDARMTSTGKFGMVAPSIGEEFSGYHDDREEPLPIITVEVDTDDSPLEQKARMGLDALMDLAHKTASNAGWYTDLETGLPKERNFGEVVALMHSELSEALEADRKGLMDDKLPHRNGVEVEFADTLIRIGDTATAREENVSAAAVGLAKLYREHGGVAMHFAMTVLRMCEQAHHMGLDLPGAVIEKDAFNKKRADHKLENRNSNQGKKY